MFVDMRIFDPREAIPAQGGQCAVHHQWVQSAGNQSAADYLRHWLQRAIDNREYRMGHDSGVHFQYPGMCNLEFESHLLWCKFDILL